MSENENQQIDVQTEVVEDTGTTVNNEDNGAANAVSTDNGKQTEVNTEGSTEPQTDEDGTIHAGGLKMIKDQETGRIDIVDDVEEEPTDTTDTVEETAEETTEETTEKAKELNNIAKNNIYTPQELEQAIKSNTLDENRLPPSVKEQWVAKQYEAVLNQAVQPKQEEPPQSDEQIKEARIKFYGQIEQEANELAMKDLGLTQDDIEAAEYSDDPTLQEKVNAYKVASRLYRDQKVSAYTAQITAQKAQEAQRTEVMNSAKSYFANEVIPKEKNWRAIDELMNKRYLSLPYQEGQKIQAVYARWHQNQLTQDDVSTIKKYYEDTRMEYYAKKNGVKPNKAVRSKPPVVETSGTKVPPARDTFNVSDFRNASRKGKDAFFNKLFATMDGK